MPLDTSVGMDELHFPEGSAGLAADLYLDRGPPVGLAQFARRPAFTSDTEDLSVSLRSQGRCCGVGRVLDLWDRWDQVGVMELGAFAAWARRPGENVVVLAEDATRRSARMVNRMLSGVVGFCELQARRGSTLAKDMIVKTHTGRGSAHWPAAGAFRPDGARARRETSRRLQTRCSASRVRRATASERLCLATSRVRPPLSAQVFSSSCCPASRDWFGDNAIVARRLDGRFRRRLRSSVEGPSRPSAPTEANVRVPRFSLLIRRGTFVFNGLRNVAGDAAWLLLCRRDACARPLETTSPVRCAAVDVEGRQVDADDDQPPMRG